MSTWKKTILITKKPYWSIDKLIHCERWYYLTMPCSIFSLVGAYIFLPVYKNWKISKKNIADELVAAKRP